MYGAVRCRSGSSSSGAAELLFDGADWHAMHAEHA